MELLYSFLGGLGAKVYDDLFLDNKIIKNEYISEFFKGFQWIILTLISCNDFNFAIVIYIINFINFLVNKDGWKNYYEKALLILFPILILISFSTRYFFSYFEIFIILCLFIIPNAESCMNNEEVSYKKAIYRSILFSILFIGLHVYTFIDISISFSIIKLGYYCLGYLFFSSLFQCYCIFIKDISGNLEDSDI